MNHAILAGVESYCHTPGKRGQFMARAFVVMLFCVCIQFTGTAQSAQTARPSCNISGPLEATASGGNVVLNVEVAHSTATPRLDYTFSSNSAGAVIKSKSTPVYNAAKNTVTQQVTLTPGTHEGEFNIKLTVTTANGSSACSQSVSVAR